MDFNNMDFILEVLKLEVYAIVGIWRSMIIESLTKKFKEKYIHKKDNIDNT